MRNAAAATLATLLAASALWAASACGRFSADTSADMTDGMAEGATDGGSGSEGSLGPDGDTSNGARTIYVIGGEIPPPMVGGGLTLTKSVLYATQQADGVLGGWAETTPVLDAVHGNAAVASSGAIVTLAGEVQGPAGASALDVPSRAAILGDGGLDGWMDTMVLPDRLYFHAAVSVNGRVYVMGGHAPGTPNGVAKVRFAPLSAEGKIGTWVETTPLPAARERLAAATDGVHIFVLGGQSPTGDCVTDVLVGTFAADGAIVGWTPTGQYYSGQSPGVAVFANKLYVLGGFGCTGGTGGSAVVRIAEIHPDRGLGSFTTGAPLPSERYGLGAVVLGRTLYAIGGDDGTGPVTDVSIANLDGTGAFDAWHPGPLLPSGRFRFGIAAH